MRLFIAEKPSMGREISKCLPEQRVQRRDGYIVQGDDVVTWAFGHVLQQAEPGDYDDKYKRWNAADLPIVPEQWKLLISPSSAKQFHTIKELIEQADTIVNAGDPDREGQLLIDEILDYVGNKKPVQRILLNALDEKSVKSALKDLRDNKDFYNLQRSALARARADWLIGMNLSRAYTLAQRRQGHKVTFPIGRVKTPTLALVVRRERELQNFVPVDYFIVKILYAHPNGEFWAQWQPKDEQIGLDPEGRLLKKEIADELVSRILTDGVGQIIGREKNKKKEPQRLPLSLSALQVAAGKAYGYDPQTVLDTAQSLYEKKLTTYPRSDCEYLPLNQFDDRTAILQNLVNGGIEKIADWAKGADISIKSRAWNDKKITAHHAIIPTTVLCRMSTLSEKERNIYFLIARSYIAQFYPEHVYEQTKLTVGQCDEIFTASGRVIIEMGWKALFQRAKKADADAHANDDDSDNDSDDDSNSDSDTNANGKGKHKGDSDEVAQLPNVKKGDKVDAKDGRTEAKQTKPPTRFTAATLLQAMKEIHKYVKNEDLKKQLKAVSGIGTEATRATIIDELITRKFLHTQGKKKVLTPTELAYMLVDALPEEMLYPDETAVWEERLAGVSEGTDSLDTFLADQVEFLKRLIDKANADIGSGFGAGGFGGRNGVPMETVTRTFTAAATSSNSASAEDLSAELSALDAARPTPAYAAAPMNDPNAPGEPTAGKCPQCGEGTLQRRKGKFGWFYGCSNYPKCKYTKPMEGESRPAFFSNANGNNTNGNGADEIKPIDVPESQRQYKCPRCQDGWFVPVEERGRTRWICSNSGRCRTACADVNGKPSLFSR